MIRYNIINAIKSRLPIIRKKNGFNTDIGSNVFLTRTMANTEERPAIFIFPQFENVESGKYAKEILTLPVKLECIALHNQDQGILLQSEYMLADIIEAMTGNLFNATFENGSNAPVIGEYFIGDDSSGTGLTQSITITSGSWSGGDAAGNIFFRRNDKIKVEACNTGAFTITAISNQKPVDLVAGSYAESVQYAGGGLDSFPEPHDNYVGQQALFNIKYNIKKGNPYSN